MLECSERSSIDAVRSGTQILALCTTAAQLLRNNMHLDPLIGRCSKTFVEDLFVNRVILRPGTCDGTRERLVHDPVDSRRITISGSCTLAVIAGFRGIACEFCERSANLCQLLFDLGTTIFLRLILFRRRVDYFQRVVED